MELDQYRMSRGMNGTYDEAYITMLTKNYRAHPSILNTYNTFYQNQLVAAADPGTYSSHDL